MTTAIALKKIGIEAVVIEAASEVKPVGAGLALAANAMMALEKVGLSKKVIAEGRDIKSFSIFDQSGKLISLTNTDPANSSFGVGNFTIYRADLHRILLSHIDPKNILTGKRSMNIYEDNDGYIINFGDGDQIKTTYLIVAEGIHSTIRKKFIPNAKIRYSGYTCWRGIVDNSKLQIEEFSETWGKAGRFGIVPMANDLLYWFACINAPTPNSSLKEFSKADLIDVFQKFHFPIPQILNETPQNKIIWNDIIDLEPISTYAFGKVVLIGDSAHATTPNLGQGACMAIEDAVILANCLAKNPDPILAFQDFERRRLLRARKIVQDSWRLGKIAQLENPLLIKLRDNFFRLIPNWANQKQVEALYQVDLS